MTKKFWNSWKNRVGETEQIWIGLDYPHGLLGPEDKIISINFENNNTATIIIERHHRKLSGFKIFTVVENETRTLYRKLIHSISFKQNKA